MDNGKELDLENNSGENEQNVTPVPENGDKTTDDRKNTGFKTDVRAVMEKTASYTKSDLDEELEKLAETFRSELKKASEAGDENSDEAFELIQQLDEQQGIEKIPEEDLCHCCGERPRDKSISEDYEYCSECRNAMKKYPLGIQHFILAFVVITATVLSVMQFATDYSGYKDVRLARKSISEQKRTSANEYYTNAISFFDENDISCKKVRIENAQNTFRTLPNGASSFSEVATLIEDALSPLEKKLPLNNGYVELRDQSAVMYSTLQAFYEIFSDGSYDDFDGKDKEVYNEIMGKIEGLLSDEASITDISDSSIKKVAYDEGIVRFEQYMLAYTCRQYEDAEYYINLLKESHPEYVTLYAYELSMINVQKGEYGKASELVSLMLANNSEDSSAYVINSFISRMKGKTDKAVEWAEKGIKINDSDPDLYRQKAMAYIVDGDYDKACEACEAGASSQYGALLYVYYVAANEKGDRKLVSSIKSQIDEMNIGYTDRMQSYIDGKLTAKQLFSEGTGDVE